MLGLIFFMTRHNGVHDAMIIQKNDNVVAHFSKICMVTSRKIEESQSHLLCVTGFSALN